MYYRVEYFSLNIYYTMEKITKSPIIKFVLIGTVIILVLYLLVHQYQKIIKYQELEPIMVQGLIQNIPFIIKGIKHNYTIAGINEGITFLAEDL